MFDVMLLLLMICAGLVLLPSLLWYGIPLLVRSVQVRRISRTCRRKGLVVLTYDDGPSEVVTRKLIELLEEHDATGTFFVTGTTARERPELIKRLREQGHEVGSHSEHHLNALKTPPWMAGRDCRRGMATLRDMECPPKYYRPPYGNATLGTLLSCGSGGSRAVWWTHDSGDTGGVPGRANRLLDALTSRLGGGNRRAFAGDLALLRERLQPEARAGFLEEIARDGGVILFHDSDRGLEELDGFTLEVTREVIERARAAGKTITTLDRVL